MRTSERTWAGRNSKSRNSWRKERSNSRWVGFTGCFISWGTIWNGPHVSHVCSVTTGVQGRASCGCPPAGCWQVSGQWPGGACLSGGGGLPGEFAFWSAGVCRLPTSSSPGLMLPRLLRKKLLKRDAIPYRKPMTFSTTWKVWRSQITGQICRFLPQGRVPLFEKKIFCHEHTQKGQ